MTCRKLNFHAIVIGKVCCLEGLIVVIYKRGKVFFVDARFGCSTEFPTSKAPGQFPLLDLSTQMGPSLHFCDVHPNEIPSLHFQQEMARRGKKTQSAYNNELMSHLDYNFPGRNRVFIFLVFATCVSL